MANTKELPWCKRDVLVQLGFVLGTAIYAAILLALVHWVLLIVYIGLWATFIIMNHYFVCRDCQFWGTWCGSFGLGRLALFKRTNKEHFDPQIAWRSMLVFYITFLFPVPFLFLLPPFWLWVMLYIVFGVLGVIIHQKLGCAKCPLTHCAANPKCKKERQ